MSMNIIKYFVLKEDINLFLKIARPFDNFQDTKTKNCVFNCKT